MQHNITSLTVQPPTTLPLFYDFLLLFLISGFSEVSPVSSPLHRHPVITPSFPAPLHAEGLCMSCMLPFELKFQLRTTKEMVREEKESGKNIPSLENEKERKTEKRAEGDIEIIFYKVNCRHTHTHTYTCMYKYIYMLGYFFSRQHKVHCYLLLRTLSAVCLLLWLCLSPSLFTLFCLVKTIIVSLEIPVSPPL